MKRSLKKIKKTRLFFIIAVVTQIASYAASVAMLYKKQKNAAGIFAAIGLIGTICSIALWKYDPDGIVPKKLKDKFGSKKKKVSSSEAEGGEAFTELTDEEIEKMLAEMDFDEDEDYEEFEGIDGPIEDLKNAVDSLSADENTDVENEEI